MNGLLGDLGVVEEFEINFTARELGMICAFLVDYLENIEKCPGDGDNDVIRVLEKILTRVCRKDCASRE